MEDRPKYDSRTIVTKIEVLNVFNSVSDHENTLRDLLANKAEIHLHHLHSDSMSPKPSRQGLLTSAKAFCNAFASQANPEKIFSHFTETHASDILIHEHGLPQLVPFVGRDFAGLDGVHQYFEIISSCLSYDDMKFSDYIVDEVVGKVSVRGQAKFTWRDSGQSWDEVFRYAIGFATDEHDDDDEGVDGDGKVVRYEIWADTGAAYLARKGMLDASGDSTDGERESSGARMEAGRRSSGGALERYVMSCENFMKLNGIL